MEHPGFFERAAPFRLQALAEKVGAQLAQGADPDTLIHDVKPLLDAGAGELSFFDNRKYLPQLQATQGFGLPRGARVRRPRAQGHLDPAVRGRPIAPSPWRCSTSILML